MKRANKNNVIPVHAANERAITIEPRGRALIRTGWIVAIPEGYEGWIVVDLPGCLADPEMPWFRHAVLTNGWSELMVPILNLGVEDVRVEPGARIARLEIRAVRPGGPRVVIVPIQVAPIF